MTLYFIVARMPNAEFIQTTQTPGSESISASNDTRVIFFVYVISTCMRATDFSSLARAANPHKELPGTKSEENGKNQEHIKISRNARLRHLVMLVLVST